MATALSPPMDIANNSLSLASLHKEPPAGTVVSVVLSLVSLTILSIFLTQRFIAIKRWKRLPLVAWLVFAIYADSFAFVFATAVLQYGLGVDSSLSVCEASILLCLACYITTKFIYLFLVEKVYVIRGGLKPRMQSRLYLFNSFGTIGTYIIVAILNFVFRFTRMENGQCVIGMRRLAMIPLISFDALVNIYLTILFLIPLSGLYSFNNPRLTPASSRLRAVSVRTFVGSLCTLTSSIVNLTVLMALDGEPGWVCLMCCNCDVLFSAIVVQWITSSKESAPPASREDRAGCHHHGREHAREWGQQHEAAEPTTWMVGGGLAPNPRPPAVVVRPPPSWRGAATARGRGEEGEGTAPAATLMTDPGRNPSQGLRALDQTAPPTLWRKEGAEDGEAVGRS